MLKQLRTKVGDAGNINNSCFHMCEGKSFRLIIRSE